MSENSKIIGPNNAEFYIGKLAVTVVGSVWYKACVLIEYSKTKKKMKLYSTNQTIKGGNFVVRK